MERRNLLRVILMMGNQDSALEGAGWKRLTVLAQQHALSALSQSLRSNRGQGP